MGRISWTRVIAGGLAAGLVINVSGFVLKGVVLKDALATVMKELGRSGETALLPWLLHGFAFGIATLWMYAAMRPRFGGGARTVLYAGTAVWFFTYFTEAAGLVTGEFFLGLHPEFMLVSTLGVAWGWAELCVATALGAWLYQRREETRDAEARVAKINWPRMMLAGLVVSMVFPLLTGLFFLSVSLLGVPIDDPEIFGLSQEAMDKLGLPEPPLIGSVLFVAWLIIYGTAIIWVYAAIRSRFGSGVKTAVYAGVAAWVLTYCVASPLLALRGVSSVIWGLVPVEFMIVAALMHLPALCVATALGAWVYRDPTSPAQVTQSATEAGRQVR